VVQKWRNRFERTSKFTPVEMYSQQVHTCIVIGLRCVDSDPNKRPSAWDIIQMLNATESKNSRSGINGGPLVDEVRIIGFNYNKVL
jgi:interleukin-1 receptor-associated kinase 1